MTSFDVAAIRDWNAANRKARNEYTLHPFIDPTNNPPQTPAPAKLCPQCGGPVGGDRRKTFCCQSCATTASNLNRPKKAQT